MSNDDPLKEMRSCSFFISNFSLFWAKMNLNSFICGSIGLKHTKFRAIDRLLVISDFREISDVVTPSVPEI